MMHDCCVVWEACVELCAAYSCVKLAGAGLRLQVQQGRLCDSF